MARINNIFVILCNPRVGRPWMLRQLLNFMIRANSLIYFHCAYSTDTGNTLYNQLHNIKRAKYICSKTIPIGGRNISPKDVQYLLLGPNITAGTDPARIRVLREASLRVLAESINK